MAHTQSQQQQRASSTQTPDQETHARAEVVADRLARLQKVTASLSQTLIAEEVARLIVEEGTGVLGANAGSIGLLTDDATEIEIVGVEGHEPNLLVTHSRSSLTSLLPLAVSARSGEPVWLELFEVERDRRAGSASGHVPARSRAAASMPMFVGGRPIGAIGMNFSGTRAFGDDDRAFFFALAQECAWALERARLHQAEVRHGSEKRLRTILHAAPIQIVVADLHGRFLDTNPAMQEMLGYSADELRGMAYTDITYPADAISHAQLNQELQEGKRDRLQLEKRYIRKNGQVVWGNLSASLVRDANGDPEFVIGMVEDINGRKQTEDELRARARQQAAVVELGQFALASDDLSALFDETVRLSAQVLEVDYCDVLECRPDRGANPSPLRLEHGVTSSVSVVIQGKNEPFGTLGAHTKRRRTFTAGDAHFLQAVAHVLATALERKRTEEERAQYAQQLTIQVLQAQEGERKRIARELHDETVQALSALLVNLDLLEPHVSSAPEETFEFERIRSIARRALDGTRVLAHALRPPILDDLGLTAALEALGAEYTQIYGTPVEVTAGPMIRERLTPEVELALFRIAQEALTNACKHASARWIHAHLSMSNSEVRLVVEDNGRGFDLAHVANPTWHGGLGLHGMRERSALLAGQLTIEAAPGQGARIVLVVPLQEESLIIADPASRFQADERLAEDTAVKVRVLLVDDHAIFREGLRLVLDTQPGIAVIGEAEDGRQALEMAERLRPDVVVMDIAMPRLNGVDATLQIKRRFPDVKVVILTTHESREYLVQIAKVGASGCVLKRSAGTELVAAVNAIARGKSYISSAIAEMMLDDYRIRINRSGEDLLTEREREVLQLVAEGLINQVIAAQLAISIKTVQRHRDNIMRKLGAHDRMDLVKYAIRMGMITAG